MKTKDLIKLLQEEDPSGELECSVWGYDVYSVEMLPAYWDGNLQVIERDERGRVVGGKITDQGNKVVIKYMTLCDLLLDYPDLPVKFEGMTASRREWAERYIEQSRNKNKQIIKGVHESSFVQYIKKHLSDLCWDGCPETTVIEQVALEFAREHIPWDIQYPEDIRKMKREEVIDGRIHHVYPSEQERQWTLWDRIIKITCAGENLKIELVT